MTKKTIKIQITDGVDSRPVAVLVQVASQYESQIFVESNGKRVNAKSIMGMMSLVLKSGEEVTVTTDGPDEDEALVGIEEYLTKA
ncbi:MAG: HPr family phosphocarrier protein [Lachnospiraceae bacterium]|nr:HPr family phosphocarrier protein [Lachnospiraceae bacterium]